ncbi:glycosyltransferase family 25 protein [Paracoccus solventivorans]|uniref:glycosyltransferase family 25 protein n=1 Tax=Paracoccus solventivorans TaxID=53463 RepID=UPI000933A13E|nr:glycosyltransferase family 25 protein [Paracoccus solventivorans]
MSTMRACGPARLIIARSPALSIHNPLVITIEPEDSPRRRRAVEEAAAHGLTPEFVMSIPKDDPRIAEIHDVKMNRRWRKHMMTPAEVSCYSGHRIAWKQIVEGGAPYRLVLEDDFEIVSLDALRRLERLAAERGDWDIIMLCRFNPKGKYRVVASDQFQLRDYCYGPTSAAAYLVTQDGTRKLLSRERIFRPVDEDFINPWELGLRALAVSPDIVREYDRSDSNIEQERTNRQRNLGRSLRDIFLKARWQLLSNHHWRRRRKN